MLLEAKSTSETTTDGTVSKTKQSRTLKVSVGGALAIGVTLVGFYQVSFDFPGIKGTLVGWLRYQAAPATIDLANIEPYPVVPFQTGPLRPLSVPPNAAKLEWPNSVQLDFAEAESSFQWPKVHWENFAYRHQFIAQGDSIGKIQEEWILCIGPGQPEICAKPPEYRLTHPIHNPDWH